MPSLSDHLPTMVALNTRVSFVDNDGYRSWCTVAPAVDSNANDSPPLIGSYRAISDMAALPTSEYT